MKKMVVAYSGGLDTSVMVKWLKEKYDVEIITVTGNLGQKNEIEGLEEKAKMTGASKCHIFDLQEEFIEDYCWPALKAGALYEGEYPMATAIGRPLLAKKLVETALIEGADAIAHGCTGKGNDQVRFEIGIKSLDPSFEIVAPLREWEFKSREEEIDYAIKNKIPLSIKKDSPYSIDENLWGIAIECGQIEDVSQKAPEDAYMWTVNPANAPDGEEEVEIRFEKGIPIAINGIVISPVGIINELNQLGSKHGIGRLDLIENRVVGIKSREIYEAPGAVILHQAHHQLEKLILDRETFRYKQQISDKIANLIYDGLWFSPLFTSLMKFVDETQETVSGTVKLGLYKGNVNVVSRYSENSLYDTDLATYTAEDSFNHKDSEGFINLSGLPYSLLASKKKLMEGINSNVVG